MKNEKKKYSLLMNVVYDENKTAILFASDEKPKIKCTIILILNNEIFNINFLVLVL